MLNNIVNKKIIFRSNQVRIFSYLIGQEVEESPFIRDLACHNNGELHDISLFKISKQSQNTLK